MKGVYDRTELLIGKVAMDSIKDKRVIVFGIGGVGGHVVEALARTGVGTIGIVDFDFIDITNINRQIIALQSTVGKSKVEVMAERIADINPEIKVILFQVRLTPETVDSFQLGRWDYIVDAIDDVAGKLTLINEAKSLGVPIICSMGTGNKLDPSRFQVADIQKTHTCPLARAIRKETGKIGIRDLKVVFSPENPHREQQSQDGSNDPASIAFVPAAAGLLIAAEVIKDLSNSLEHN